MLLFLFKFSECCDLTYVKNYRIVLFDLLSLVVVVVVVVV